MDKLKQPGLIFDFELTLTPYFEDYNNQQAGAELCQAQQS